MRPIPPRRSDDRGSVLEAWDRAIIECFEEIERAPTTDRSPYTLRLTRDCVRCLDETLARIRPQGHRFADGESRSWALRSAAIEVATRSYVGGVRARQGPPARPTGRRTAWEGRHTAQRLDAARGELDAIVCALPPDLIAELDLLATRHWPSGRERSIKGEQLMAARSVVVESAVTAWLILRGYRPVLSTPHRGRGLAAALRALLDR